MLAIFLLWLVRRDFDSGLSFHFIGLTAVTLLLDWPLAIIAALAAQLGLTLPAISISPPWGPTACCWC